MKTVHHFPILCITFARYVICKYKMEQIWYKIRQVHSII